MTDATFSTYEYLSVIRIYGGGFVVAGQRDHLPTSDTRMKIGDYTITAKLWKGMRCYLTATIDGRKIFDGCFIGLREWSSETGRMQSYAVNFDKVVGQHISNELASALVEFLNKIW